MISSSLNELIEKMRKSENKLVSSSADNLAKYHVLKKVKSQLQLLLRDCIVYMSYKGKDGDKNIWVTSNPSVTMCLANKNKLSTSQIPDDMVRTLKLEKGKTHEVSLNLEKINQILPSVEVKLEKKDGKVVFDDKTNEVLRNIFS